MKEQDVFILADQLLNDVIQQIQDDQWDIQMPESFATKATGANTTLRDVINYHAYDEAWVPDMLAGRSMEEVGKDAFDGNLLGDDPKGNCATLSKKAIVAAKELDDLDQTVHFSYGDYPAREALKHITSFRGLRVYDIAKVIGADTDMPPELVQALWDQISPNIDEWRSLGVFPPAVEVPEDASLQDKLLGMTGRDPNA